MSTRGSLTTLTSSALVVAALGIVIQILSGADYPLVPPGLIILLVPAALVWFGTWRWVPIVGSLAALSQFVGLFGAGEAYRLSTWDPFGDSLGLWIQLVGVAIATVSGVAAVATNDRRRVPARQR